MKSSIAGSLCTLLLTSAVLGSVPDVQPRVTLLPALEMSRYNQAAWWSPIFVRVGDVHVSYLAPGRPEDKVIVARWSCNDNWQVHDTGFTAQYNVGHTQTSIAIDGDGYIHLFFGMHNDPMGYARSVQPASLNDGFHRHADAFPAGRFTYPNATTTPDGDIYMIIRNGSGNTRAGELFHYNTATQHWSAPLRFANQPRHVIYPDHIIADDDDNLHLVWEWAFNRPRGERHAGTYARFDPSERRFYRADGRPYPGGTIRLPDADVFEPKPPSRSWDECSFQSAKMTLGQDGRPIIAYAYSTTGQNDGYEHRLAVWSGTRWDIQTMSQGGMSLEKPWVTYSDGLLRYYGSLTPNDNNIYMRASSDMGETWSEPVAITNNLFIQRPVGVTYNGADYLYLPSIATGQLFVAKVTIRPLASESPDAPAP